MGSEGRAAPRLHEAGTLLVPVWSPPFPEEKKKLKTPKDVKNTLLFKKKKKKRTELKALDIESAPKI